MKPCPFCGNAEGLEMRRDSFRIDFHVFCPVCLAKGPHSRDEDRAEILWDTRELTDGAVSDSIK